jgi:Putative Actinobacterial Holin-X, holin superfamily III
MTTSDSGLPPTEEPLAQQEHAEPSLGELVGEVAEDVSRLLRQQLDLAKAELRQEAVKASKAAGMLGVSGFAGCMVAVLLSFAAVFGLAHVIELAWATVVIAGVWAVIGVVLFVMGQARMRAVSPVPEQTIETVKEDARWARNLTK